MHTKNILFSLLYFFSLSGMEDRMPLISGMELAKALAKKKLEKLREFTPTTGVDAAFQEEIAQEAVENAINSGLQEAWRRHIIGKDNAQLLFDARADLDKILSTEAPAKNRCTHLTSLSPERRKKLCDAVRVLSEISGSNQPLLTIMKLQLPADVSKAIMSHLVPSDSLSIEYKPSWRIIIDNLAAVAVQGDIMCVTTRTFTPCTGISKGRKVEKNDFYDCAQGVPLASEKQRVLRKKLAHIQSIAASPSSNNNADNVDQSYLNIPNSPILYLSNGNAVFFNNPRRPLDVPVHISVWDWRNGIEKVEINTMPHGGALLGGKKLIEGLSQSIMCPSIGIVFNSYGALRHRFPWSVSLWQNQSAFIELDDCYIAHTMYEERPCTVTFIKNNVTHMVDIVHPGCDVTKERIFRIDNNKAIFVSTALMHAPRKTAIKILEYSYEGQCRQTSVISVTGNVWYALQLPNHLWGMLVTTDRCKDPERYAFVIVDKNNVIWQEIPLYEGSSYYDASARNQKKHGDLLCAAQVNNGQVILSLKPRHGQGFVMSLVPRPFRLEGKTVDEMLHITQTFGITKKNDEGIIGKLLEYATL